MLAQVPIHLNFDDRYPDHQQRDDENDHTRSLCCGAMHHRTNDNQDQPKAAADPHSTIIRPIPLSTLASPRRRASLVRPR